MSDDSEQPLAPQASALAFRDWRFSVDQEGIGWAIFDREGQSANCARHAARSRSYARLSTGPRRARVAAP